MNGQPEPAKRVPVHVDAMRLRRQELKMSQSKLGALADLGANTISKVETGKSRYLTEAAVARMESALELPQGALRDEGAPDAPDAFTVPSLSLTEVQPDGQALRRARRRRRMRRKRLAAALGVDPVQLKAMERGRAVAAYTLARVAIAVGLDPLAVVVGEVSDEVRVTLASRTRATPTGA